MTGTRAVAAGRARKARRDPLRAAFVPLTLGSDHQVYSDSSFEHPGDLSQRLAGPLHPHQRDTPSNIDPTKLNRAAFIAAASGYALARIGAEDAPALREMMQAFALERAAGTMRRKDANATKFGQWYEREMRSSLTRFLGTSSPRATAPTRASPPRPKIKGTMGAFGYDYFTDHYPAQDTRLAEEHRYEALNLCRREENGQRDSRRALGDLHAGGTGGCGASTSRLSPRSTSWSFP